ncbi:unnamed protein product, partial [marine sediment metagenome]
VRFDFPQSRKMDFFDSHLYWFEGKVFHKQGEIEQGNQCLTRALEIYPGNIDAFEEIAELTNKNKFPQDKFNKFTRAIIKHYQHKIDIEPFSSIHYYYLASVYLVLEEPIDEAINLIKQALLLNPAVLGYQITLARLYAKNKRYQEAIAIIKPLLNLRPYEKDYQELLEEFTNRVKDKDSNKANPPEKPKGSDY